MSSISVKKSKSYLVVCIICYVITFPFIPLYLLIDRGERERRWSFIRIWTRATSLAVGIS